MQFSGHKHRTFLMTDYKGKFFRSGVENQICGSQTTCRGKLTVVRGKEKGQRAGMRTLFFRLTKSSRQGKIYPRYFLIFSRHYEFFPGGKRKNLVICPTFAISYRQNRACADGKYFHLDEAFHFEICVSVPDRCLKFFWSDDMAEPFESSRHVEEKAQNQAVISF